MNASATTALHDTRSARDLRMYIGGEWVVSDSGQTFPAYSPGTGQLLANIPELRKCCVARLKMMSRLSKSFHILFFGSRGNIF